MLLVQLPDHLGQPVRAIAGGHPAPDPGLEQRLDDGQVTRADAGRAEQLEVLGDVHGRGRGARALPDHLEILGREFVHHHPAVFPVGDLGDQRRHPAAAQVLAGQAQGLVVGLHLADELGVAALRLDERGDAGALAARVGANQPVRQVHVPHRGAVRLLARVLLDEHPAVAAVPQRADELEGDVRVIGQGHLGRRKATHPPQRLEPEHRCEVLLPSPHVKPIVLDRRGGRNGVAPRTSQPLHRLAVAGIHRDRAQCVEYIMRAHLAQPVQQRAEYSSITRGWAPSSISWGMNSPIRL